MATDPDVFDRHIGDWTRALETPWSKLRYRLVYRNLKRHLPEEGALRILDAGGGNGLDSLPFAEEGNSVTLVDYSEEMLAEAQRRAKASGAISNLVVHHRNVRQIPDHCQPESHDLVLLHNVMMYMDDPKSAILAATHSLTAGGLFSLMEINRHSEPMNSVLRAIDPDEALQKMESTSGCASAFGGVEVCRYTSEDLEELLRPLGFRVVAIYGVLCVTGYIYDNEPKYDPEFMSQLERLEESMSTRLPFSQIARYVQVLAKRS